MLAIKQKYKGMKKDDLVKALSGVGLSITHARMSLRDDPKAHAQIAKLRYEKAVIRTMLQMTNNTL